MSAGREDLFELQIWTWLIHSLCLNAPMLSSRDGRTLPAFLAVKLSVIAWIPVLLFGLAGSLQSVNATTGKPGVKCICHVLLNGVLL